MTLVVTVGPLQSLRHAFVVYAVDVLILFSLHLCEEQNDSYCFGSNENVSLFVFVFVVCLRVFFPAPHTNERGGRALSRSPTAKRNLYHSQHPHPQ